MGHDPNPSTPPIGEAIFLFLRKISPLLLSSVSDVSKVFPTHLSPCSVPFQDDWWLLRQSLLKNCFFLRELKLKGTQSEGGEGVQDAPKVAPGSPLHHHQSACTAFYPIQLGTTSRNFLGRPLSQKKKGQSGNWAESHFSLKRNPQTGARPNSYWTGRTGRRDGFPWKRPRSTGFSFSTCPIRVGRELTPSSPLLSERRFSHFPRKQTIASSNRVPTCLAPFSTTSHPFPSLPTLHSASASPL